MEHILALFSVAVVAAEFVVSPLPSDYRTPVYSISSLRDAQVLGLTTDQPTPTPTLFPTLTPTPLTPTPTSVGKLVVTRPASNSATITPRTPKKNQVKIAMLGDSMTDTLGPGVSTLVDALQKTYPGIRPTVLNYGVGGTNLDYGIERITHGYEYLGQQIPSLASQNPDIVILESFAYNPFSDPDDGINHHWMSLAKAVNVLKTTLPNAKIVIAATIAPNNKVFGDGAAGISFSAQDKQNRVALIKRYLESTVSFARGEGIPLVNAYHPSLGPDGNGKIEYINGGDHIHTSEAGRIFFAGKIVETFVQFDIL